MITLMLLASLAQDLRPARPIGDVIAPHSKLIRKIAGVVDVVASDDASTIVIRVDSRAAKEAVELLVAKKLCGYPVKVTVGPAKPAVEAAPEIAKDEAPPRTSPGTTVAEERAPSPTVAGQRTTPGPTDCDIVREKVGLPERSATARCKQVTGWTNDPDKVRWVVREGLPHWESKELGKGRPSGSETIACPEHGSHGLLVWIAYTYIRHRWSCPSGLAQLLRAIDRLTP